MCADTLRSPDSLTKKLTKKKGWGGGRGVGRCIRDDTFDSKLV